MEHGKAEAPEQAAPAQAGAASGAGGAVLGALAALGVLAVGAGYWVLSSSTPPTQAPAPVAQIPAPVAEPVAEAAAHSATQAPPVAARFDQFRASPEGAITLAGHAEPGATVEVLLDGQVVDTVQALAGGSFASVVLAGPAATARSLSVRITGADGVARERRHILALQHPRLPAEAPLEHATVHLRIARRDHQHRPLGRLGVVEAERLRDPLGLGADLPRRELHRRARLVELEHLAGPAPSRQMLAYA